MAMTGEITTVREGWLVRASLAVARWSRRRTVRADLSEVYFGEDERRASLEEQVLLSRERQAAERDLDRITSLWALYRGF
jgi:hypothetical protein